MAATSSLSEDRRVGRLDRWAIALSGLCVVHCVATVLLAATLASAGAALADPAWHEVGFTLAILIGAAALGRGYALHRDLRPLALGGVGLVMMAAGLVVPHGAAEIAMTVAGVSLLALAHRLNARRRPLVRVHRHD
jgi:hypothetical protein